MSLSLEHSVVGDGLTLAAREWGDADSLPPSMRAR